MVITRFPKPYKTFFIHIQLFNEYRYNEYRYNFITKITRIIKYSKGYSNLNVQQ